MIAHILRHSGHDCTAFLGGVSKNYNTNLLIPADPENNLVVVEADEYDRSFLTLHPDIAVITSMDADHLDIYGSAEYMNESYNLFASQVKTGGTLIYREGLPLHPVVSASASYSVAKDAAANYSAMNISIVDHRYRFDWTDGAEVIGDLSSGMPGRHNVENAIAAVAAAKLAGIPADQIAEALRTFTGVKRRFDYRLQSDNLVYIDDYAHHPEELKACILAARELYPGWRLTGIFQPHLYTRTRDFSDGFASSLSLLDELILLDIYPARELPIEGVTSEMILGKVTIPSKKLCSKEAAVAAMRNIHEGVVLTLGAGDIDQLVDPVQRQLTENLNQIHS
jgi:UDP-N-acetylmuramate--alanine ligase